MTDKKKSGSAENEKSPREKLIRALSYVPIILVLALSVTTVVLLFFMGVSAEDILSFEPENPYIAAAVMVFAFAVKSLSVFFPIPALYIFSSVIFSLPTALCVNLAGIAVTLTVPYFVGKISGKDAVSRLVRYFDKKGRGEKYAEDGNLFYVSYMLRIISVLPADLVSMIFGSCGADFGKYIAGSLLGSVPSMISITCMGATVTDPGSPEFLISTAVTVVLAGGSMLIHRLKAKNHQEKVTDTKS